MNLFDSPGTLTAPDPPTSVHPPETTVTPKSALASRPTDPLRYAFRHASWAFYRTLTYQALRDLRRDYRVPPTRVERFIDCGRSAWILKHRHDADRYKIVLDCCHDRFCVPCGRARAQVVAENLSRKLAHTPHRLLTLTLKHSDTPLHAQLDRLFRYFKRLRSRSFWRERCDGGAALLELSFNFQTRLWHPHLHVILAGRWFPRSALASMWLDVTGDSTIVDIRLIRQRDATISYITKYVTKPISAELVRDLDTLRAAIVALTDRKTLFTFGTWSRWHLLEPHDSRDWVLYSHADALPHGTDDAQPLNDKILALYEVWARHGGEDDFTIRGPPQREFDDPFDA